MNTDTEDGLLKEDRVTEQETSEKEVARTMHDWSHFLKSLPRAQRRKLADFSGRCKGCGRYLRDFQ